MPTGFTPAQERSLKQQAKLLQFTATLVVIAAILNFLRVGGVFPFLFAAVDGSGAGDEAAALLRSLVVAVPTFFYIGAVWIAGGIFARVGQGEIFTVRNSRALAMVGGAVGLGAVAAIAVTPPLLAWIDGIPYRFESAPSDTLLAVIGGLIQMLGFTHAKAGALRSELDEII